MLLVCISIYLKSHLTYKFLISGTFHPNTLRLRKQGCEDLRLLYKPQGVSEQKNLGNTNVIDFYAVTTLKLRHIYGWLYFFVNIWYESFCSQQAVYHQLRVIKRIDLDCIDRFNSIQDRTVRSPSRDSGMTV
jgi:hypothetical protein